MELKLENGEYSARAYGGTETVSGTEETLQRVLMRLKARRGGFLPMPEFGSRLHELCGMKKSDRGSYAKQFVFEALSPEKDVSVLGVEYSEDGDGVGKVSAELRIGGDELTVSVDV